MSITHRKDQRKGCPKKSLEDIQGPSLEWETHNKWIKGDKLANHNNQSNQSNRNGKRPRLVILKNKDRHLLKDNIKDKIRNVCYNVTLVIR